MKRYLYAFRINYSQLLSFILWLMLTLGSIEVSGQSRLALGNWQMHVPYHQGKAVADAGDKVYTAAEQGLFYFDKEFNSLHTLSKTDGLHEQDISTIGYDAGTGTLVIAYASTHIDLLQQNRIVPISDISRKAIPGNKSINHIYIHNKLAYLSCSFGVVVLDLQKSEVRASYANLGANGESISINATTILRDSLYLATENGILAARRTGVNLQDYRNWKSINAGLPASASINGVAVFNNKVYTGTSAGLFSLSDKAWRFVATSLSGVSINSLTATENYLTLTSPTQVFVLDQSEKKYTLESLLLQNPAEATTAADGKVWIADSSKGLIRASINSADAQAFAPSGPFAGSSFKAYTFGEKTYILGGGYTESHQPHRNLDGFYTYTFSEGWKSYNRYTFPNSVALTQLEDVVDVVYNPVTEKTYFGSYGSGLLEWAGPDNTKLHNQTNSPLRSFASTSQDILVPGVDIDREGNVWVINSRLMASAPGLFALLPDGSWKTYTVPGAGGNNFEHLLLDDAGQKWLYYDQNDSNNRGIAVFDTENNRVRRLGIGEGKGGLPHSAVYSMVKDLNGDIWVGTGSGVAVFYNPTFIWGQQTYDARLPIIDRRPLLDGRIVRAIAVDGANRKWIGTDDGLWLFAPDGDELIHHFTTKNSPLPSDKILSVAVNHTSGEVFAATNRGLVSYRSDATITEGKPNCTVIFPNPVPQNYTGQVGVSGLPNDAYIRITDIFGTLVYKTQATGGTLAWDARDYNGKRVKAGVYLVLSSDKEGKQTCISKIAVQ